MVDKHSFPHYPRYYCTACDNLLTAEAERDRTAIKEHITNADDADHRDRSGSSISAPITTTGTETDWVEPIWKSEGDREMEQVIYLALLRYPHLSIAKRPQFNDTASLEELLGVSQQKISSVLFDSPSIVRLRARAAYEYTLDSFTRPVEDVTVDPKERLIHRRVITVARDESGCSIKSNGGFELPDVSEEDIAEEFNEKRIAQRKPESAAVSNAETTSDEEVQNVVQNSAIEPQLPKARHHAAIIEARSPDITIKETAAQASNELGRDITYHQVSTVTNRQAWESFDGSKLSELVYQPEVVARDFYAVLQETDLTPPSSVEELCPNESSTSTAETPGADQASTPDVEQSQQPPQKTDGGQTAAETNRTSEQSITPSLTAASPDTTDDIATLVQAALAEATADSERAEAALNIYKQLPSGTRQAILTDVRTEASDEVFTLLANHL